MRLLNSGGEPVKGRDMCKLWEVFRDLISTLKIPGSLFKARVGPPQRPVMHNDGVSGGKQRTPDPA